jgi:hypothetical protein
MAPPSTAPVSAKLTVANVRGEAGLLFRIGTEGSLTFDQPLPAGEAVDLKTTVGQRWAAVFPSGKDTEVSTFVAGKPEAVWLLRPSTRKKSSGTSCSAFAP